MVAVRSTHVVEPVSTVDAVARVLRTQILEGTLPAGTQLREAELSKSFGVSRQTVRSALQALVHEGIARHEANRGAFVPEFSGEEIVEMFRLREILEAEAVRQIVATGDLAGTRAALQALRELPPDADWGAVRDADLAIHRALIDTLDNQRIVRTFETLLSELRLSMLHLRREFEHRSWVERQHEDFLAALEAGEEERAKEWIRNHNAESIADITASLGEGEEEGGGPAQAASAP